MRYQFVTCDCYIYDVCCASCLRSKVKYLLNISRRDETKNLSGMFLFTLIHVTSVVSFNN